MNKKCGEIFVSPHFLHVKQMENEVVEAVGAVEEQAQGAIGPGDAG